MWELRRVLSGLEGSQALEMMLSRLRKTQTNVEFLYTISKTTGLMSSGGPWLAVRGKLTRRFRFTPVRTSRATRSAFDKEITT